VNHGEVTGPAVRAWFFRKVPRSDCHWKMVEFVQILLDAAFADLDTEFE